MCNHYDPSDIRVQPPLLTCDGDKGSKCLDEVENNVDSQVAAQCKDEGIAVCVEWVLKHTGAMTTQRRYIWRVMTNVSSACGGQPHEYLSIHSNTIRPSHGPAFRETTFIHHSVFS